VLKRLHHPDPPHVRLPRLSRHARPCYDCAGSGRRALILPPPYYTVNVFTDAILLQVNGRRGEEGDKRSMRLKDRLAELRQDRGWTLRALRAHVLELTGAVLSISYLSELERTDALPSLETLARLAAAYSISPQDLLAPVDLPAGDHMPGGGEAGGGDGDALAQYPPGLRALIARGLVTPEWAGSLARIEFRGQRPRTEDEWQAIYGLLKAFLDPGTAGIGQGGGGTTDGDARDV